MDISRFRFDPIDFSGISQSRWVFRRTVIGFLLFLYYAYAFLFSFSIASSKPPSPETPGPATTAVFEIDLTNHLVLMMTFGFLGGVFFVTRTFVRTRRESDCSVAWYLTRPLQGVLMALFIYYAFRAGQLVFYSGGEGKVDEQAINVFTLSILAIIAGMFTDHAYERLYSIAESMLKPKDKPAASTESSS